MYYVTPLMCLLKAHMSVVSCCVVEPGDRFDLFIDFDIYMTHAQAVVVRSI